MIVRVEQSFRSFMIEFNLIETEANYSGDHVWSWLLLVRNVPVVTGGLLELKAQDHIHTSNSFLRQWKTERPPGYRLESGVSRLWELGDANSGNLVGFLN